MRARVAAFSVLAAGALVPACRSGERVEVEPRYQSVHNTLTALGLSQSGPLLHGTAAEGQEQRIRLALKAECATVVAIGSPTIGDLDLSLRDGDDHVVAKDTTIDSQATVRLCSAAPGKYTLVVRAARGGGEFLASVWTGKGDGTSGAIETGEAAAGTCETPTAITPGSFVSSTSRGSASEEGGCGGAEGKEIVYQFSVPERRRVTLDLESQFDSFLYLRRDECSDAEREVACRQASGRDIAKKTRIDTVLEPGVYYAIVDGSENGSFRLNFDSVTAPDLGAMCREAPMLGSHHMISNWTNRVDLARGQCGTTTGPEAPFRLDLAAATRVRIRHRYEGGSPTVHVRKTCIDAQSEVGCSDSSTRESEASYVGLLQPGKYVVFADTAATETVAASELTYESQPAVGRGTPEDTCAGALPLNVGETVADTFDAVADVKNRCVPEATPDVFYRLAVPSRMHVTITAQRSEALHTLVLYKSCGASPQVLDCGQGIDTTLTAGTYYVGVHATDATAFGEIALQTTMEDVTARENACKGAPSITVGGTVRGTTKGGASRFTTRCGNGNSPDRVYKITVPRPTPVTVILQPTGFRGLVSIRSTCIDIAGLGNGELACNPQGHGQTEDARAVATLPAGTSFIVVTGAQSGQEGAFTLKVELGKGVEPPTFDHD